MKFDGFRFRLRLSSYGGQVTLAVPRDPYPAKAVLTVSDKVPGVMDPRLERIVDKLPAGFADLEADAMADGHRQMTRLAAELTETPAIFHAAYAYYLGGRLAGIGAMTDEPAPTGQPTWRMRRFYVHREFRRRNVAYAIAMALLHDAAGSVSTMTVHAGDQAAAQFWEAIGFSRVVGLAWSHQRTMLDTTASR